MCDEPDAYQTYVLRLWRGQCRGRLQWRASIESPHTGEHQSFGGLEQLFDYLREHCDRQAPDTLEAPRQERGWSQEPKH